MYFPNIALYRLGFGSNWLTTCIIVPTTGLNDKAENKKAQSKCHYRFKETFAEQSSVRAVPHTSKSSWHTNGDLKREDSVGPWWEAFLKRNANGDPAGRCWAEGCKSQLVNQPISLHWLGPVFQFWVYCAWNSSSIDLPAKHIGFAGWKKKWSLLPQ